MTRKDSKPCKRCGTSAWTEYGSCIYCKNESTKAGQQTPAGRLLKNARNKKYSSGQRARELKNKRNDRYEQTHSGKAAKKARDSRRRTKKSTAGGSYSPDEWLRLCAKYENRCLCCGRTDVKLTADHVIPVSAGGTSDIDNIQPLCMFCNQSKGSTTIDYRTRGGIRRWVQKAFSI